MLRGSDEGKVMLSLTFATLIVAVSALNGIVVPASIKAGEKFEATFENAGDSKYRIYVAAALMGGSNGPTCYLVNSTTLDGSIDLTIPMSKCILACDGVTPSVNQTAPAHATSTKSNSDSATGTDSAAAETSSGAASRQSVAGVALAGVAGLAMIIL